MWSEVCLHACLEEDVQYGHLINEHEPEKFNLGKKVPKNYQNYYDFV